MAVAGGIAAGSPFPTGFVVAFLKLVTPGCGNSSVVHAGFGCTRGDGAEWWDGVERQPANSGIATTDPI